MMRNSLTTIFRIGVVCSLVLWQVANAASSPALGPSGQNQSGDTSSLELTAVSTQPSDQVQNVQPSVDYQAADALAPNASLFPEASPIQQRAFDQVAHSAMPMTPDEIVRFKDMLSVTKRVAAAPPGIPPKPLLTVQPVSLSPGSVPPVVRLQEGFVTSVLFTDSTGAPWPIEAYDLGNSSAFNIQWEPKSNIMIIQAMSMYTYGNLAIRLRGLTTPVMVTLVPGQQVVDYRLDLQIDRPQPQQTADHFSYEQRKLSAPIDSTLLTILNGITPKDAELLTSSDADCQAWVLNDKMYLRTRLTLLSPGWVSVMRNSDGTKAYEITKTSTIVVSKYGEPITINFKGLI